MTKNLKRFSEVYKNSVFNSEVAKGIVIWIILGLIFFEVVSR